MCLLLLLPLDTSLSGVFNNINNNPLNSTQLNSMLPHFFSTFETNPHSFTTILPLLSVSLSVHIYCIFLMEEFEVDHLTTPTTTTTTTTGTSFSQLLLADDDDDVDVDHQNENAFGIHVDQTYNNFMHSSNTTNNTVFSIHNTPKMLCFGGETNSIITPPPHKSAALLITNSSDSSSANSSCNHTNKKRNGSGQEPGTKAGVGGQRASKKNKAENPMTSTGHAKKKEKLGERIAALQQLVSPFGKTDTASVLHEATGYIRFLQDQVQVLCSPYLQSQHLQYQPHHPGGGGGDNNNEVMMKDLRSRGLCLIPVECTIHVASSNGADFWSPAANVSPSPKK